VLSIFLAVMQFVKEHFQAFSTLVIPTSI